VATSNRYDQIASSASGARAYWVKN